MDEEIAPRPHPRASRLRGKKVIIKFGGSSIGGVGAVEAFAKDIALLVSAGVRPIVVHGGGPEINEEMRKRGLKVKKVAGLRVTDEATLRVANEVLASINSRVVSALKKVNLKSIGMAGAQCGVLCRKVAPAKAKDEIGREVMVDLGNVGEVTGIDPAKINQLCSDGMIPVIFPICVTREGEAMNVNADTVAAHIARAVKAEELVLVTDVPGIMRELGRETSLIKELTSSELDELINTGAVSDGMIPKVEACRLAVKGGVKAAHLVSGKEKDSIVNQLLSGDSVGTRITA